MKDEDLPLLRKAGRGDAAALQALWDKYSSVIHCLAMRITRDHRDAEEVVSVVYTQLWRKAHTFNGTAKVSSWIYRITTNACFMVLRKRKSAASIELAEELPEVPLETTPLSLYEDSELRTLIRGAIDSLGDIYRVVFMLRDIEGLTNEEVAEVLGISVPAVKSRVHRARLDLRYMLIRRKALGWLEVANG